MCVCVQEMPEVGRGRFVKVFYANVRLHGITTPRVLRSPVFEGLEAQGLSLGDG